MSQITVTGASDDLIEIGGDISEEFNWYAGNADDDEKRFLAFSDGTILSVRYDEDGLWRFARVATGSCRIDKTEGDVAADKCDLIILEGNVAWVVFGTHFVCAPKKS